MITHSIIKVKPKVVVPVTPPGVWPGHEIKIHNQKELQEYLEASPPIGCYVVSTPGKVTNLYAISFVMAVQDDFEQYKQDTYGQPETHFLMQVRDEFNQHVKPWMRWAPGKLYRLLDDAERKEWISDNVQDSIQKYIAQRKEQGQTP